GHRCGAAATGSGSAIAGTSPRRSDTGAFAARPRPTFARPVARGSRCREHGALVHSLAVSTIASYGLAIVGVVLMVSAILPAFTTSMTYPTARLQLTNLLRTNPNQAEMVSRAMKGTFGEALAMGIKTAGMTKSRDPTIITKAIYPGYDA